MHTILRVSSLVIAAALGWWLGAGLDDVSGEATGGSGGAATSRADNSEPTTNWSQWGGDAARNNTPVGHNIPTEWNVGRFDYRTGAWDATEAKT